MRRFALLVALVAAPLAAQVSPADTTGAPVTPADTTVNLPNDTEPFEVVLFKRVYNVESAAAPAVFHVINDTSFPAYWAAAPVHWGATFALGGDLDAPLRLTVAQTASVGLTVALKNVISRERPYVALDGVTARDRRHQGDEIFDPYSFPSGHTSTAFVLATSLSLSYPEWYVVVPSMAWASTMGVARMWLGVHYPSDVVVGAALGAGTAAAVHFLMPDVFSDGEEPGLEAQALPVRVVVPL